MESFSIASELNPSQRKYLDNLLAQGKKIAPGKKPEDMTPRERIEFDEILTAVENFFETREVPPAPRVSEVSATTAEGREIHFELNEQLESWREFYKKNKVDWISLPDEISITAEQAADMQRLMELGFDRMIIIPDNLSDEPEKYEKLHGVMSEGYKKTWTDSDYKAEGNFKGAVDKRRGLRIILTRDVQNLNTKIHPGMCILWKRVQAKGPQATQNYATAMITELGCG